MSHRLRILSAIGGGLCLAALLFLLLGRASDEKASLRSVPHPPTSAGKDSETIERLAELSRLPVAAPDPKPKVGQEPGQQVSLAKKDPADLIQGHVRFSDGKPSVGAVVLFFERDREKQGWGAMDYTDAKGHFALWTPAVLAGRAFHIEATYWQLADPGILEPAFPGQDNLEIVFPAKGKVCFDVFDGDTGERMNVVALTVQRMFDSSLRQEMELLRVPTGEFVCKELPPGTFDFRVAFPDASLYPNRSERLIGVEIVSGQTTGPIRVVLPTRECPTVRLLLRFEGENPPSKLQVSLFAGDQVTRPVVGTLREDGKIEFGKMMPGTYQLSLQPMSGYPHELDEWQIVSPASIRIPKVGDVVFEGVCRRRAKQD